MLQVYADTQLAGRLFKPESDPSKYRFAYQNGCPAQHAVSLSMPVTAAHAPALYLSDYKSLHPVFDMNLPEGALAERLRKAFGKAIPNFDDLALLKIVGRSQIGRLRFAAPRVTTADTSTNAPADISLDLPPDLPVNVPTENLSELLTHDGAQGLFDSLLTRYAVHSGISGAMPKVMVRNRVGDGVSDGVSDALNSQSSQAISDSGNIVLSRVTQRGATHIIKAWTDDYPRLAENEYFCLRAARHAKLDVPNVALSQGGRFLVVERFDLQQGRYLGFEDFCVLSGKTATQKYDASYESVTRRIQDFVSPEQVRPALEAFFKALTLSCALKNGDAHLKNFGVLYVNTESAVRLAPIYDLVTTTVYIPQDTLALTLAGTKRWPKARALMAFARAHCGLPEARARMLLDEVTQGVKAASTELQHHRLAHPGFQALGDAMLAQWQKGLSDSLTP